MKAVVVDRPGSVRVVERSVPSPAPGEVCIRVRACGICGTDVHVLHGQFPARYPIVPGHELGGEVVAVGAGVDGLKPGDRVAVDPNVSCGQCDMCRQGHPHFCRVFSGMGTMFDGGFAEYTCCPARLVWRIPDELSFEQAAFAEPLSCCIHGIDRLSPPAGSSALVIGGGAIGLLMSQLLLASGASTVVVVEPREERRRKAAELGARVVGDLDAAAEVTRALGSPDGAHVVVECVGKANTVAGSIRYAARGAKVLWFGVAPPDMTVPVSPETIFRRELTIMGSFVNPNTFGRALSMLAAGRVEIDPLVSGRYSLEEASQALEDHRLGKGVKGLIVPVHGDA